MFQENIDNDVTSLKEIVASATMEANAYKSRVADIKLKINLVSNNILQRIKSHDSELMKNAEILKGLIIKREKLFISLTTQTAKTKATEDAIATLSQKMDAEITALRLEHARKEAENIRIRAEVDALCTAKADYAAVVCLVNRSAILRNQVNMEVTKCSLSEKQVTRILKQLC